MELGQRVKMLREEQKMTQRNLAAKTKYLNQSQISKMEQGKRKITAFDLLEIAKALEVDISAFVLKQKKKAAAAAK